MIRDLTYRKYYIILKITTFAMIALLNITTISIWNYKMVVILTTLFLLFNYIFGLQKISIHSECHRFKIKIIGNFLLVNTLLFYIGGYQNASYAIFHFFIILTAAMMYSPLVGLVILGTCFTLALKMVFTDTNILNSFIIHSYVYGGAFVIGYFCRMEGIRKKRLDHKIRELEALYKISKMIDRFPGTEKILDNIAKIVAETVNAEACLIMLYDEEQDLLAAKAGYGVPKEAFQQMIFRQGEGIERQVIENKGRAICKDEECFHIYRDIFQDLWKIKTVTAIPLFLRNKIIGTLSVYDTKGGDHVLEDIELLDMMGSRIGMILENDSLYKQLRNRAIQDGLTGLYNHKQFYERLKEEIQGAKEKEYKVYLLMIDIDRFKAFNDRYGHLVGDKVLVQIAKTIKNSIRDTDYAARYGGEEFAVILPNTDYETAAMVADRIRNNVKKATATIEQLQKEQVEITVSIGIACYPNCTNDITNLVDIADIRMYKGKEMGGDRVIA